MISQRAVSQGDDSRSEWLVGLPRRKTWFCYRVDIGSHGSPTEDALSNRALGMAATKRVLSAEEGSEPLGFAIGQEKRLSHCRAALSFQVQV